MFQSIQAKHRRYHWTWPGEKKKTESAGFIGSSGKGKVESADKMAETAA